MQMSVRVQLRFGDFDPQGHVSSIAYFHFLETARGCLYSRASLPANLGQVIKRQEIEYLAPIGFETDFVEVHLCMRSIGRTSYELGYSVSHSYIVYATAATVMVSVGPDGRPQPVPSTLRAELMASTL